MEKESVIGKIIPKERTFYLERPKQYISTEPERDDEESLLTSIRKALLLYTPSELGEEMTKWSEKYEETKEKYKAQPGSFPMMPEEEMKELFPSFLPVPSGLGESTALTALFGKAANWVGSKTPRISSLLKAVETEIADYSNMIRLAKFDASESGKELDVLKDLFNTAVKQYPKGHIARTLTDKDVAYAVQRPGLLEFLPREAQDYATAYRERLDFLRQWGINNGIDISLVDNYMTQQYLVRGRLKDLVPSWGGRLSTHFFPTKQRKVESVAEWEAIPGKLDKTMIQINKWPDEGGDWNWVGGNRYQYDKYGSPTHGQIIPIHKKNMIGKTSRWDVIHGGPTDVIGKQNMRRSRSFTAMNKLIDEIADKKNYYESMKPVKDLSALAEAYEFGLKRTVANQNLLTKLEMMVDSKGNKLIQPYGKAPEGYRVLKSTVLDKYLGPKIGKVKTAAPKEIANYLDDMLNPWVPESRVGYAIDMLNNVVKRTIMFNPIIHGQNIFTVALTEGNLSPANAIGILQKGHNIRKWDKELLRKGIQNGLNFDTRGTSEVYSRLKDVEGISEWLKPIAKIEEWNDKILWDGIAKNTAVGVWDLNVQHLIKQGYSEKEAMRAAASYTNTLTGLLPQEWYTSAQSSIGRYMFFARDWTASNLRILSGAMGVSESTMVLRAFRHTGLTEREVEAVKPLFKKHLAKGVFGLYTFTDMLQWGMTKLWDEKPQHIWENPEDFKGYAKSGLKNNRGVDMYVMPPWFRYIHDIVNWNPITGKPVETFINKLNPLFKNITEALINYHLHFNKPLVEEGAPTWDNIAKRAYHVFAVLPEEHLLGLEGTPRIRTWQEKAIVATGTWMKSGPSVNFNSFDNLTGVDKLQLMSKMNTDEVAKIFESQITKQPIEGNAALKIIRYKQKKEYERGEKDYKMEELLQRGNLVGAMEWAIESERYREGKALWERVLPYLLRQSK